MVLVPPEFYHKNVEPLVQVNEGEDASLDCQSSGHPSPNVTWTYNQNPISYSSYMVDESGLLKIKQAPGNSSGKYMCHVHSVAGEKYRTFDLIVKGINIGILVSSVATIAKIVKVISFCINKL